ncbi:MAG: caspase family protein [Leptothrix sp. (in: b-proteobacteria)]
MPSLAPSKRTPRVKAIKATNTTRAAKSVPAVKAVKTTRAAKPAQVTQPATGARAAVALSLHIGLNRVNPKQYSGWDGPLSACEFDASDMAALATARAIKPTLLLTKQATRARVLAALRKAAATLVKGDYFLLTYSGHGGQVDDVTGEETDRLDETWCLYDGQLIDDELYLELSQFAAGVRVLVLSDSCHSGTVTRAGPPPASASHAPQPRQMPPAIAGRVYREHKAFYDDLQKGVAKASGKAGVIDPDAALAHVAQSTLATTTPSARQAAIAQRVKAGIVLISGCQDNQTSMDGLHNGAFTEQLLKVWRGGLFKGNHALFHARIRGGMPPTQSPRLYTLGATAAFVAQAPFTP